MHVGDPCRVPRAPRACLHALAGSLLLGGLGCTSSAATAKPQPDAGPTISDTDAADVPSAFDSTVAQARFERQVPWIGTGTWIMGDPHVHTTFSSPDLVTNTLTSVVDHMVSFGGTFLATTDHGFAPSSTSDEKGSEVAAARLRQPTLIMPAALEWDFPHGGSTEHATVLLPQRDDNWAVLREFTQRFGCRPEPCDPKQGEEGLRWLAANATADGVSPVVLINHPTKERMSSLDLVADVRHLRGINDLVVGFEGGPGHQAAAQLSLYANEPPIDRWDPGVARAGDAWDTLLAGGLDVWAAGASSDSHRPELTPPQDYWPGEFSETWMYVREPTTAGVLEALRAGTYFGVVGHIARNVELSVTAEGLPRAAFAGEVISVPEGSTVDVALRMQVPAVDWKGNPNRIDQIDLVVVTADAKPVTVSRAPLTGDPAFTERLMVPRGDLVVRARGRRDMGQDPALLFYTNPIRIRGIAQQ
jgi:hypothetical protein